MTLWTVAREAPLAMGFSRQEYQSGLPCPSPGDLSDPGTEPVYPTLVDRFLTTEQVPIIILTYHLYEVVGP